MLEQKKTVSKLGNNDLLKIYVDPKNLRRPWYLSPLVQNVLVYLAEILYGV